MAIFKRIIITNNEFVLGTMFGILVSPLASFLWHILWNYVIPGGARMNEPWLSVMKFGVLFILAVIVLVIYYRTVLKPKREAEKKEITHEDILKAINTSNDNLVKAINNQTITMLEIIKQNRGVQNEQQSTNPKQPN